MAGLCSLVIALCLILTNTLFALRLKEEGISGAVLELGGCAENISKVFQENYTAGDTGEALFGELYKMAEYEKFVIWIADSYGNIIFRLSGDENPSSLRATLIGGTSVLPMRFRMGKRVIRCRMDRACLPSLS